MVQDLHLSYHNKGKRTLELVIDPYYGNLNSRFLNKSTV